jgi:hypothetical protein
VGEEEAKNAKDKLVGYSDRVRPLKWIVKKPDPHQNEKAAPAAELANPIDRMAQYWPLVISPQQRVLQTGL